jgi:putative endonuclease
MFFVYILQSQKDNQLYVGFTENLKQRVITHNKGSVPSTKSRRPWKLIYFECYTNQNDALRREKYLKTTPGKIAVKHMLRETLKIPLPTK